MVTVYDPETLRAVKVPADDPRALDFLTKAEATKERREQRARRKKVEDVVQAQAVRVAQRTLKSEGVSNVGARSKAVAAGVAAQVGSRARSAVALGRGSATAGVAALGVGGTAAAVGAALALGYGIGTLGLRAWRHLSPDQVNYRKALAFRKAREEFAAREGRAMTVEEVRAMGRGFLDSFNKSRGR